MGKTWAQKMETGSVHIEVTEKMFAGIPAGSRMVISTPREVRDVVCSLQPGESLTVPDLRQLLAARHGVDATCPLTASIFLRIVAEAAWEEHLAGKPLDGVTPFWRAISPKDNLAKKLACGVERLTELRSAEGIS